MVQRQVEEEEEELLQTKEATAQTHEVTPNIESNINALKGGGQPLPESVRAYFEPRFGHDFSRVRVHTNAKAAESASALDASAYTVGMDIIFGAGRYQLHTGAGRQLLAHELSHTIQQGAAASRHAEPGRGDAAAPSMITTGLTIQRAMKFEIQTKNVVWRTGGKKTKKLPRKFGPKDSKFLHKGKGARGQVYTLDKLRNGREMESSKGNFEDILSKIQNALIEILNEKGLLKIEKLYERERQVAER